MNGKNRTNGRTYNGRFGASGTVAPQKVQWENER